MPNLLNRCVLAGLLLALAGLLPTAQASEEERARLVAAMLGEGDPAPAVEALRTSTDPLVRETLAAWRIGTAYACVGPDGARRVVLLEEPADAQGRARARRADTGTWLTDAQGAELRLMAGELTAVDNPSKLRKVIKRTLDLMALSDPDPRARRDAASGLGFQQNPDYLPAFTQRLAQESEPSVRKALAEAIAITRLAGPDEADRRAAIAELGRLRSIAALDLLKKLASTDAATASLVQATVRDIESYIARGQMLGTAFRGLSLASVLLIAALGLAITFGLMGIINMAHGELIMVGAYVAYETQNLFARWFGPSGAGHDAYFLVALPLSFAVAAAVGLLIERAVIRFLYRRPLESLLATWGVSLILQQTYRSIFGAANVQVSAPAWLSGSFAWFDVLFAYNRLFVIGFAAFVVFLTWFLLTRTPAGLQIRAVMQNRAMAACMGIRTERVNMMTFAFGSGLAGMAGACLSQIGNVGPSLGQSYIIDCFMVVVLGGVGNLVGTLAAAFGIGMTDQLLQPLLGAVLGKIVVLVAIILFLQWRPAGLFTVRTRGAEAG